MCELIGGQRFDRKRCCVAQLIYWRDCVELSAESEEEKRLVPLEGVHCSGSAEQF